jgi:hypothetical protein
VTAQSVAIHSLAGHAEFVGDELRRLTHGPILEGTPESVDDERVAEHGVAVAQLMGTAVDQVRRAAHALDAAANEQMAVAGTDRLCREHDRLDARAADFVDRGRADRFGHAASNGALARNILAESGRHDVPDQDFVDLGPIRNAGAFERRGDSRRS